jgi:hypothetical protein
LLPKLHLLSLEHSVQNRFNLALIEVKVRQSLGCKRHKPKVGMHKDFWMKRKSKIEARSIRNWIRRTQRNETVAGRKKPETEELTDKTGCGRKEIPKNGKGN